MLGPAKHPAQQEQEDRVSLFGRRMFLMLWTENTTTFPFRALASSVSRDMDDEPAVNVQKLPLATAD